MNYFKKYFLLILLLLIHEVNGANERTLRKASGLNVSVSKILPIPATYAAADFNDIPQLLELINIIENDEDDRGLLVILPSASREEVLFNLIQRKRIFIAKIDGLIISFLKFYLIDREIKATRVNQTITYDSELTQILVNELCCCNGVAGDMASNEPSIKYHYHDVRPVNPLFTESGCDNEKCMLHYNDFEHHEQQTFVYYGGAYTVQEHRGKGYGSELLKYASTSALIPIIEDIKRRRSTEFILAYGQAEQNKTRKLMLRQFTQLISTIHALLGHSSATSYTIFHEIYQASVPAFDECGNALPYSFEERPGFGNLVIHYLP